MNIDTESDLTWFASASSEKGAANLRGDQRYDEKAR